ncbi:MAG: hypothetical protein C0502_04170 [Opitutus sp.]|nr:hypothetical protein [Opitutus sp.]
MTFRPLKLRGKLGLLLAAMLGLFFTVFLGLRLQEYRELTEARAALRAEAERQLGRWIEIANRPLQEFLLDLAPWTETRDYLARPDPAWARSQLDSALADHHLEAVWLLRADGHLAYAGQRDHKVQPPPLPAPPDLARATRKASRIQFFAPDSNGLWQFMAAPVPAPQGAAGWLVAARRWDEVHLTRLGTLTDCTVKLEPPSASGSTGATWRRALTDLHGRAVQDVVFTPTEPQLPFVDRHGRMTVLLFAAFGTLLLTALVLAVNRWVLRPVGLLGRSLRENTPAPVAPLLEHGDEFRPLAQLVQESFARRAELEREIGERRRAEDALRASQEQLRHSVELRARLARDLHDHVIQSIYAAGLGLESVRAQMSADPFGAEGRIRHCMDNLNETIRQVRSYINDLEPDAHGHRQQFTAAVRALTNTMHQLWPVEFVLDLDDTEAAKLTNVVEIHALQIVRECLSNALRHGQATRVVISLQSEDGRTVLRVRDNGCGFDAVQRTGTGRGLVNLTTRAREMGATLRIDSKKDAGTAVTVRIGAGQEAGR